MANFSPTNSNDGATNTSRMVALVVAFAMAVTAMANATPSVWIIPKFGPLQAEYLRAGMFIGAVLVVLLTTGFTVWSRQNKSSPGILALTLALDLILLALSLWVAYEFATVNIEIQEGLFFFDAYHGWVSLIAIAIVTILCWKVWGLPLAGFCIVATLYYFTGQHWPGMLNIIPRSFTDALPEDMLFNLGNGMFGFIFETVIYTVFPFIIFGALLEVTGIGNSLIRLAFRLTRKTRGGPAHAAVLASSLFGTMSGAPVANVVGTGVMTIPMIKRRGFTPQFAGGIEATASTGGQIVPPIMGAAALVMADQLKISYLVVITAALLPALFYYLSLFFTVTFESRRLNIQIGGDKIDDKITAGDAVNLTVLLGAISVLVGTLFYGLSAAAAGVFATAYMLVAGFFIKTVRSDPSLLLLGFSKGGVQFARLTLAIAVVGVVLGVLAGTGLPVKLAIIVDAAMGKSLLLALVLTGLTALVFGMGMPTLPAYLTIILILGPTLLNLGLSLLVAHMFVFYFGVASAITPPVAIAAYAAASIAGAKAMATALTAFRIGLAMFIVPFAFAFNPELLLVEEAGGFEWADLLSICLRLVLALWLLTSAFSRFDATRIGAPETLLRLALAGLLLVLAPLVHWGAFTIGVGLIVLNRIKAGRATSVMAG
ncbi:MAG: TRAP transporter fused permease subunit [Burkholderiaceae bacterium]